MDMESAIIIYIVALLIIIIAHCLVVTEFANIAEEKGFARRRYWHFCFWLGFAGYLIVIALPNRKLTELSKVLSGLDVDSTASKTVAATPAPKAATNYLPEL